MTGPEKGSFSRRLGHTHTHTHTHARVYAHVRKPWVRNLGLRVRNLGLIFLQIHLSSEGEIPFNVL